MEVGEKDTHYHLQMLPMEGSSNGTDRGSSPEMQSQLPVLPDGSCPPTPQPADIQPLSQGGLLVPAPSQFGLASGLGPYPSGFPTLGLDSLDCKPTIRRPGRASLLLTSSTHFIPLLGLLHSASHPLLSLLTGK